MSSKIKSNLFIVLIAGSLGFLIGLKQGPEKTEENEKIKQYKETVTNLERKIETLTEENFKENVKTTIVENVDGSKVTTQERIIEKIVAEKSQVIEKENQNIKEKLKSESEKITTFHGNHNAIGARSLYILGNGFDIEGYLRAGMKCFIFNCYAEASYLKQSQNIKALSGIEYRF